MKLQALCIIPFQNRNLDWEASLDKDKRNFLWKPENIGSWLLCLALLSTIFQLYHGSQFYWWRKPEYPEKTTDHFAWVGFDLTTLLVTCTDSISSCKANFHTIATTTVPTSDKDEELFMKTWECRVYWIVF